MATIIDNFVEAIGEEIQEVRRRSRTARFEVREGRRLEDDGSAVSYRFEAASAQRLRPDTAVILILGEDEAQERIGGTVLEHKGARLTVSLERDVGEHLPAALMMTDETFLLERLRAVLGEVKSGEREIAQDMAEAALGLRAARAGRVAVGAARTKGLNADQARSLSVALGSDVSYLWGPPGTGKTATMARLVGEMVERGLSVLIVSNANLAVDTLLERVCADLDAAGKLARGAVVRYGNPVREAMVARFGDRILPGHVFAAENPALEKDAAALEARIEALRGRRRTVAAGDARLGELDRRRKDRDAAARRLRLVEAERQGLAAKLVKAELQLTAWRAKAAKQPGSDIARLIEEAEHRILDLESAVEEVEARVEKERDALTAAEAAAAALEVSTGDGIVGEWSSLAEELEDLRGRARKIHERRAEFAKALVAGARVVAATAYQAYLTQLRVGGFDAVVIDEASMLPLPLVYYAAGLARRHVVIAGDFRQLPTVAVADTASVRAWYAKDIFVKAGIAAAADAGRLPANAVALRTQYRMRRDVCELINKAFYNGILKTPDGQHEGPPERGPFAATLSVLDTRAFDPWAMRKATGSRLNPLQALVLAGAAAALRRAGSWSADAREFGVITAYAAQAETLNLALQETGGFSVHPAATVHKFQGSEKDAILFEVADGRGLRLGGFFRGGRDDLDCRLLNVAFSRARKRVVLVGNMDYMSREAVSGTAFSGLLAVFRDRARRVDAVELLKALGGESGMSVHGAGEGRAAATRDIGRARSRVEIFLSGFRVKEILHLREALAARLGAGLPASLRIDPGAETALAQEASARRAVSDLARAGLAIEIAERSGQEAGLLVDRSVLWILPAGGFGRADAAPFLRAEAPGLGSRLVAALREGATPWPAPSARTVAA